MTRRRFLLILIEQRRESTANVVPLESFSCRSRMVRSRGHEFDAETLRLCDDPGDMGRREMRGKQPRIMLGAIL
jgi:hypothetical protein